MRDGMHEVRLAETGAAANEERIVTATAPARCRDGGRVRELIGGTHHEIGEGVLRIHACWSWRYAHRRLSGRWRSRRQSTNGDGARANRGDRGALAYGGREIAIERPCHLHRPPRHVTDRLCERRYEVIANPLEHELVARRQRQDAVGQVVELNPRKPLVESRRRTHARIGDGFVPKLPGRPGCGGYRMVTGHRHTIHTLSPGLWKDPCMKTRAASGSIRRKSLHLLV